MKEYFGKFHLKYPWADSVISLVFGAVLGYLLPAWIESFELNNIFPRIILGFFLAVVLLMVVLYYKHCYPPEKKSKRIEKAQEDNTIAKLRFESEIINAGREVIKMQLKNESVTFNYKIDLIDKYVGQLSKIQNEEDK